MAKLSYYEFLTGSHDLYDRYYEDWQLALKSYYGGVEYRRGRYLKAYDIDQTTPSEVITTYDIDDNGVQTGAYSTRVDYSHSRSANETGSEYLNSFYEEKLRNVCSFPYTRLYVSEYNSILFKTPPHRDLPELPELEEFVTDVDGEGNSINEFWSQVDTFTTVCGVVWISCIKPADRNYALWRMHKPIDVPNWEYRYKTNGELELSKIVLKTSTNPGVDVFQVLTAETIDTVFVITDEDIDAEVPDEAVFYAAQDEELGYYKISQPNELGYIPVRPVYQSSKIYNGIGHTPIFDIAQIQRSIYGDMGEIYSAVSYGAHGVNVVDEETAQLNDGALGAEPGSIIRVPAGLNGQPNYVYEFVAPPLDSIAELRELVDQKIEKMNSVAMIRSEELIKASRSGAQLEQYDSKLEAFIRKKAVSLENAEYHMWKIWFDWLDKPIPPELAVSYSRQYSKRSIEQEITEMSQLMALYEAYKEKFHHSESEYDSEIYSTPEQAQARAAELGGSGFHEHQTESGETVYMPFVSHDAYEAAMKAQYGDHEDPEQKEFANKIKQSLQDRMMQLMMSSYSENGL